MAITPRSGSSSTTSTSDNTVDTNIPSSQGRDIHDMPFITNSALNKFAINTSQYANVTKSLQGFMKGKRILVTYYRLLNQEATNNRTNVADLTTARSITNTEYQKIINLEITLPKEFEFEADTTKATVSVRGEAMFYPNMNPRIGDLFLTGMGDGRTGVCRISTVKPLSWRDDRIFLVEFVVHEFVDDANHNPIEDAVTQISYFSKENYLGGTAALLSEQTYVQLAKIKESRLSLCRFFHQAFFDENLCSYVRPDGIYDPCLVQFMSRKIDGLTIRPKNLMGQIPKLYRNSLWARLEDRFNATLYQVNPCYKLAVYDQTRMGVFVTELHGKTVILPESLDKSSNYYLFSENFYSGIKVDMTSDELMVYDSIMLRSSGDLSSFITDHLDLVMTLPPDKQFYKIPICIHLIDMALQSQYRDIDAPSMNYASASH